MKNILYRLFAFFLLLPNLVFAQTTNTGIKSAFDVVDKTVGNSYDTQKDINSILGSIVLAILSLIGIVFIIFIIYAGYLWMTASGNEQKVDKSKEILKQSIIGLIVIVGAYAIAYFVIQIFGSQANIQ